MSVSANLLPLVFWSVLCALCTILGLTGGYHRGYRHGFEDGLELGVEDAIPNPLASGPDADGSPCERERTADSRGPGTR